jgi:hypothetical protein
MTCSFIVLFSCVPVDYFASSSHDFFSRIRTPSAAEFAGDDRRRVASDRTAHGRHVLVGRHHQAVAVMAFRHAIKETACLHVVLLAVMHRQSAYPLCGSFIFLLQ